VKKRTPSTGGSNTAEDSYIGILQNLFAELVKASYSCPKTIVYARLKWCGFAYDFFHQQFILHGSEKANISMVSQYHAPCKSSVSICITD
jgi:hypothetical protein